MSLEEGLGNLETSIMLRVWVSTVAFLKICFSFGSWVHFLLVSSVWPLKNVFSLFHICLLEHDYVNAVETRDEDLRGSKSLERAVCTLP